MGWVRGKVRGKLGEVFVRFWCVDGGRDEEMYTRVSSLVGFKSSRFEN